MQAVIFIGSGKISYGKLSQALDHGALTVQIAGDFDDAMQRVQQVSQQLGIYLVNSVNPFRLEGQKTIMYRVLESAAAGRCPTGSSCPAATSATPAPSARRSSSCSELGLIDRVAAAGGHQRRRGQHALPALRASAACAGTAAGPTRRSIDSYYAELDAARPPGRHDRQRHRDQSAGEPARSACGRWTCCDGVVREVTDQEILDAKAQGRRRRPRLRAGQRRERRRAPSCCARKASSRPSERVVCILTGHQLKDPTATVAYHTHRPGRVRRRARQPRRAAGPRSPTGPCRSKTTSTRSSGRSS